MTRPLRPSLPVRVVNRIHWTAVGSAIVTAIGVLSEPAVLNLVPERWAHVITGLGILCQAVSKAVHTKGIEAPADPATGP